MRERDLALKEVNRANRDALRMLQQRDQAHKDCAACEVLNQALKVDFYKIQDQLKQANKDRVALTTRANTAEILHEQLAKDFDDYRMKYGAERLQRVEVAYEKERLSVGKQLEQATQSLTVMTNDLKEAQASLSLANESLRIVTLDHENQKKNYLSVYFKLGEANNELDTAVKIRDSYAKSLDKSRNEVESLRIELTKATTDLSAIERAKPEAKDFIEMTVKLAVLEGTLKELGVNDNVIAGKATEMDFIRELASVVGAPFPPPLVDKVKTIIRAYAAAAYKQRKPVKEYQRALGQSEIIKQQTCSKCKKRVYAGEEVVTQGGDHVNCKDDANWRAPWADMSPSKPSTWVGDIWIGKDNCPYDVPAMLKELEETKREVKQLHDDLSFLTRENKAAQNVVRRLEERRDTLPKVAETNEVKHLRIIECDVQGVSAIQNMLSAFISAKTKLEIVGDVSNLEREVSEQPKPVENINIVYDKGPINEG